MSEKGIFDDVGAEHNDIVGKKYANLGDILVAPSINPAWTPHFPSIAGVVTDIGGIFGHAAIVAREYQIPAVVATGTATKIIKSGDRIKCDGDNGIVHLIDRG